MKIGIIGAGNIGGNLGKRWGNAGHEICFGVRDPDKVGALLAACGDNARAEQVAGAAAFGEVVVLAVPGKAVEAVVEQLGDLGDRVLIDATNHLKWNDGPVQEVFPSAAEALAKKTGARVVKAFNTFGAELIDDPVVAGEPVDLFLCGDDADARAVVAGLGEQIGFHPVDMGPLQNAAVLENIAIGWIWLAMKGGRGRGVAFKLVG